MSDHVTALSRIPAPAMAKLTERSSKAGLRHLAGHLGLIALCTGLIAAQVPFWGLLLPIQGVLLVFLFTLEHEATHQTPFAQPGLNTWVGRLCGLVILLPFTWFRYFHLAHHRHTNDPKHDPELLSGAKPTRWRHYLLHVSGLPYWLGMARQLLLNAAGRGQAPYLPKNAAPRITSEARWMLVLYIGAAGSLLLSSALLWLWVIPMLIAQPALRLYLLAEHGRCAFVANMLENTRTTYTNRAVRFLAWNMPYHTAHHAAPQVPFHKLPELNTYLAPDLQVTATSYTTFTKEDVATLSH